MKKFFSNSLIFFGIIFLLASAYLFYIRNFSNKLSFEKTPQITKGGDITTPYTISIPKINKTLSVIPSEIKNGKWETTEKGVSYLKTTPIPGDSGNSVMYAHNWNTLLGDLYQVKPNDEIVVVFSNGESKKFIVENTATVNPSQTDVIENTSDARLTLYTCTGFLDSKRLVVIAKPSFSN